MDTAPPSLAAEIKVEAYCVHCRSRRLMLGATQVSNRRGGHDLKGHCSICGKSMYRLGGWTSLSPKQTLPPASSESGS
ncbi:hypothetical protein LBMAG21_11980 [Armatimonadota bacterium]|nr:DUF5679 domain-containing protein [Armatimonadota bacterium]GDX40906.1 hypothetical protein LBMAG21_11980 [Armatimonadota bacterium]